MSDIDSGIGFIRPRRSTRLAGKRKTPEIIESNETLGIAGTAILLDGLDVEDGYVKIDNTLLKRLKPAEVVIDPIINLRERFSQCPEYADMLIKGTPITQENIISNSNNRTEIGKKMGEMVANLPLDLLALQRSALQDHNYEYRYKPALQPRVTNQYHSGRCWLFASLNALRYSMQFKFDLENSFEFSSAYLFFWDKIERSNMFFEGVWALRDCDLDDRYLQVVFTDPRTHLLQDGGYWQYFKNLVCKYGLVPKDTYKDSFNCLVSGEMNDTLVKVLNQMALVIRSIQSRDEFDTYKRECNSTIYDLVVRFMGEPPTHFNWQYKDSGENYHEIKDLTPEKFFRVHVPHDFETKMTFIHDPRYPEKYFCPYHVEYATNMVGSESTVFINLPLDVFKAGIAESLRAGEPCWFACDVATDLDSDDGVMATERFDYQKVLGVNTRHAKEDMMWMKTAAPTHAMVINGVDMDEAVDDNEPVYRKWRVENSWGIQCELAWHPDRGCWQMSDAWFDQNVFMATVDLKYFDPEVLKQIMDHSKEKFVVRPWDVFGTVAAHAGCSHCEYKMSMKQLTKKH